MKIQTKIELESTKHSDFLPSERTKVRFCLDLKQVCAIRETLDEESELETDCCLVYMNSGESFIVYENYHDLILEWQSLK